MAWSWRVWLGTGGAWTGDRRTGNLAVLTGAVITASQPHSQVSPHCPRLSPRVSTGPRALAGLQLLNLGLGNLQPLPELLEGELEVTDRLLEI